MSKLKKNKTKKDAQINGVGSVKGTSLGDLKIYQVMLEDGTDEYVVASSITQAASVFEGTSKTMIQNVNLVCEEEHLHISADVFKIISKAGFTETSQNAVSEPQEKK
jgi:hypothetical protein